MGIIRSINVRCVPWDAPESVSRAKIALSGKKRSWAQLRALVREEPALSTAPPPASVTDECTFPPAEQGKSLAGIPTVLLRQQLCPSKSL